MEVKTIKGIDEDTWSSFKSVAAKNKMKTGEMFKVLLKEYEKKSNSVWDVILSHKPILSKKQYEEFETTIKELRKEQGWRV